MVAAGKNVIYGYLIGSNDGASLITQAAVDTYWTDIKAYNAAIRGAGAKLVYGTQIADNTNVAYDSTSITTVGGLAPGAYAGTKAYLRALALAEPSNYDALCDFQADPNLATYSATYFESTSSRHPNALGHSVMATRFASAVQSLLV